MIGEKDKQRHISEMARKQRKRHRGNKLVDELIERGVIDTSRLDETMDQLKAESDRYLEQWAKVFLDFHPLDEQRTPEAIGAWAIMGKVDQEAISAVVKGMVKDRLGDPEKAAMLQESHDRMVAARQKAAVHDGDLCRARPAYCVGVGWHPIIDDLVNEFAEIEGLGFLAAHEKWGELRVAYLYDGERQTDVDAIVKRSADRCLVTCWYCGQPGRMRQERWWRVRCDEHWSAQ